MADISWYSGNANTYTLTSADQLSGLAKLCNGRLSSGAGQDSITNQGKTFAGITIVLGNDIDLTPYKNKWESIGIIVPVFKETALQELLMGIIKP